MLSVIYTECHVFVVMLSVIMKNVIMPSVVEPIFGIINADNDLNLHASHVCTFIEE